ncbi:hypothetical protein TraAM80_01207 [Trypanosoma rangeli]|uniref:Uncharacterized protein n=1 Tax=Trypanosoma rangeli TaxID=5698 RepID=A0A3R7KWA1_TRYRA|nr:uncharacterized protein TraAM80_01207 [Trypanosoma rangeli]RNF10942.1 hypothetical protein TraAM80_01207 [Trypanosoma rangeli]|eukprot:RNF10942.1 hypothetical protein TraAM80_01207 [Trypanosoma rangeli]
MLKLHHAVRLRLLAQRVSVAGIIGPSNSGMAVHALRQLGVCNVHDCELLKRIDEVYPQADLRSRANMFHCLACCVRERLSLHEGLPKALPPLLTKMQESMLGDVDELSPTECILVMEGVVKLTPYRCASPRLEAVLRGRSTALVDVVSNPVELIGIARIVVEATQEPHTHAAGVDGEPGGEYHLHPGWSQELREISGTIESRLDSFGKQDLLTLVDAVTLWVAPRTGKSTLAGEDAGRGLSEHPIRDVADECRPLLLQVLNGTRQRITTLSPSQVSAWLLRVVRLHRQHHPLFMCLLQQLDEQHVRSALSLAQLSTCIESLGGTMRVCHEENTLSCTELQFVARVVAELLEALVYSLEQSGGSSHDCSMYLVPATLSLSEGVVSGRVVVSRPLSKRLFRMLYRRFGILTPRERADIVTAVFHWGLLSQEPTRQQQRDHGSLQNGGRDVFSPALWCDAVLANINAYNTLDALQIMNEVSAVVYAEGGRVETNTYNLALVRPMLLQLHERLQGQQKELHAVTSSCLTRYLTSMSKLGLRRKADYYVVLKILQQRELTNFESLRALGVVARHHLRAVPLITNTVRSIPYLASSLHPKQKCLLLKCLGQVRAQRLVRAQHHSSLALGMFLMRDEVLKKVSMLSAIFALVGLVELRQFENETIDLLLQGPLSRHDEFAKVRSSATLSELIAALCRVDRHRVPTTTIQAVLSAAVGPLATSRSFFVDLADVSSWLQLVKERPSLGSDVAGNDQLHCSENEKVEYMAAVTNYVSVAAAIAKTRLLDIAGSNALKLNTFLFSQMAIGYRLGVSLPPTSERILSHHLDTKHLPQLLSDPRQVVGAVTTACHIWRVNPEAAVEVFLFAEKNYGSLGAQEALLLGIEMTEALRDADASAEQVVEMMRRLQTLAWQSLKDARRLKKLSVQEVALGARYGVVAEAPGVSAPH